MDPKALKARLEADTKREIKGVVLTHNETSTGVQNPMGPLADAIRAHGAYSLVDSVSGLAASEFTMDAWGFDVVVAASQKALGVPPGMAMVAVSPRAWEKMASVKSPRYYLDLKKARDFQAIGRRRARRRCRSRTRSTSRSTAIAQEGARPPGLVTRCTRARSAPRLRPWDWRFSRSPEPTR